LTPIQRHAVNALHTRRFRHYATHGTAPHFRRQAAINCGRNTTLRDDKHVLGLLLKSWGTGFQQV